MTLRVVVTGAAGRLGSTVVDELMSSGEVDLTRFVSVHGRSEIAGTTTVRVDLRDPRGIRSAIQDAAPKVVVHLGGVTPRTGASSPDFSVNQSSTRAIVSALARSDSRIILASTAGVYGDSGAESFAESSPINCHTAYAQSKFLAEQELLHASGETLALRIFNIFGPGFDDSIVTKLLGATAKNPAVLRGWHGFVRDYIHAADVAAAVRSALEAPLPTRHATLNIGSGVATSNANLVTALSVIQPLHYEVVDWPTTRSVAAIAEASRVLGFTASRAITLGASPAGPTVV